MILGTNLTIDDGIRKINEKTSKITKEYYAKENQHKMQIFMLDLIKKIMEKTIAPYDAYWAFMDECYKIFPKSSGHPMLKEQMINRFQTYLQICTLQLLAESIRVSTTKNHEKLTSKKNNDRKKQTKN